MSKVDFVLKVQGVSSEDLVRLRETVIEGIELSIPQTKDFGPNEWQQIVIVARDAGTVASTVISVGKIANWLYEWIKTARKKKSDLRGVLQAKGKQKLSISEVSENEIEGWLNEPK